MATIAFQVTETAQTTVSKSYTLADSQMDRIIAAYQSGANSAVNGTASRSQVLQFWLTGFIQQTVNCVALFEAQTAIASLPTIIPINPQ